MEMTITKTWAMPNGKTFKIKPIKELILKYIKEGDCVVDAFANEMNIKEHLPNFVKYITNDLDEQYDTDYHMDALDFLKKFEDNSVDVVLYDPPYSPNQVKVCYEQLERTVTASDVRADYWTKFKREIARIIKPGGHCITCMWNTNGIGKCLGMTQEEILVVAHGGMHNDTLCTVERKLESE